jgi:hypothetical protein
VIKLDSLCRDILLGQAGQPALGWRLVVELELRAALQTNDNSADDSACF